MAVSPRYGCRLPQEIYDTLYRTKYNTMIDASKIVSKALEQYFITMGVEIRCNTEMENNLIFDKK